MRGASVSLMLQVYYTQEQPALEKWMRARYQSSDRPGRGVEVGVEVGEADGTSEWQLERGWNGDVVTVDPVVVGR